MSLVILLEALSPISHGDPGQGAIGNATPFRTESRLFPRNILTNGGSHLPAKDELDAELLARRINEAELVVKEFAQHYPLEPDSLLTSSLQELTASEFVSTAFIFSLIRELNRLNGGEGEGLFSGMERYKQLLVRINIATGSVSNSLYSLYSLILNGLKIDTTLSGMTDLLPALFAIPKSLQMQIIGNLAKNGQSVIGMARAWFEADGKNRKKAKEENLISQESNRNVTYYNPKGKIWGLSEYTAESQIPVISGNSLRHTIFRETLFDHLRYVLGYKDNTQLLDAKVPKWAVMLFSNGGNVEAGKSAPDNTAAINYRIAETFPSLDLLGGCVPTHILNEGKLQIGSYTLCLQNNPSTHWFGYESDIDAGTILQTVSGTRHTPDGMPNDKDSGQMIFSYTVMKPGSKIIMTLNFSPNTSDLTRGAAYFALRQWADYGGIVGGRGAQGCGQMAIVDIKPSRSQWRFASDATETERLANLYEKYINDNADKLKDELVSGRLGWAKPLA